MALEAEELSIKRYACYIPKLNEWQWITQPKMKLFCVENLFGINQLGLLNMLGRAPTLGPQGFQLLCWFLPSKLPPFPNTPQCPAQRKPLLKFFLFLLNPNLFYFSEKHFMFCCSAIWALWHVQWVISPSGCNCHLKAFNKIQKAAPRWGH